MIVDGRSIAKEVLDAARRESKGFTPSFAAFTVAPSPATLSYLKMKKRQAEEAGIQMRVHELDETLDTDGIIEEITRAAEDAVIVQLPLPPEIETMRVLESIPLRKDADVLSPEARTRGPVMHPIAESVADIFNRYDVAVAGRKAVVVGQGWLVGQPVSEWLAREGADLTIVTLESGDLREALQHADIVISGTGSPGLITPELVRDGAVVVDVGTSELGGSIAGDVDPRVAQKASLFTPVPGGVGPIAVSYLMKNVVALSRLRNQQ